MKLKFEKNLEYQIDAVNSITDIFQGQNIIPHPFTIEPPKPNRLQQLTENNNTITGSKNILTLSNEKLLANVRKIQLRNGLKQSETLFSKITNDKNETTKKETLNFTIEMETGTGKTYVYLRTIFELNKKYGFTKFIIAVPSIAVKEGTNKSLEITQEHFKELYDNVYYDFFTYDSSKLEQVRSFAVNDYIQIMVINIDAFRKNTEDDSKNSNIIHREIDKLNGLKPIDFIQAVNPILIIDEPQSVDNTEKSKKAIQTLNPLFILRYSATHKEKYNLMYKLDPIDAYEKKLVKKIEVYSYKKIDEKAEPYIYLKNVNRDKKNAVVEIYKKEKSGIKLKNITIKQGDFLDQKTKLEEYSGFIVNEIYFKKGNEYVNLGERCLKLGETINGVNEDEMKRVRIRNTILEHLNKELNFKENRRNIKVLSLFFIDRVSNYRAYDKNGKPQKGKYAKMFEEEFIDIINKNPKFKNLYSNKNEWIKDAENCHDGYFAQDDKGNFKELRIRNDGKLYKTEKNKLESTFNKIMRDKERLLSFEEPLRFIWSHSALREGWDNPNVFQICTLNETKSEMKKRQEIGRGLRIAVNQEGERVHDSELNILSVIANESYEDFVSSLQEEMTEDEGIEFRHIQEHIFSNINISENKNNENFLGEEGSKEIWDNLFKCGYIDSNGKITNELLSALKNENVVIPARFESFKFEILHRLKKYAEGLKIQRAENKTEVKICDEIFLGEDFKSLWDKIKFKSTYRVDFNSEQLIRECAEEIKENLLIGKSKIIAEKSSVKFSEGGITGKLEESKFYNIEDKDFKYLPDIITRLQNETSLTRKTSAEILIRSGKLDLFRKHPERFIEKVVKIINSVKRRFIVDGIKYKKIGDKEYYSQELFLKNELFGYLRSNMIESSRSLYTHTVYDSGTERKFVEELERLEDVKVYTKLPRWFRIDTPLGTYNPDWAILLTDKNTEKLYFVVETKGSEDRNQLKGSEEGKIKCGKKHFTAISEGVTLDVSESFRSLIERRV